MVRRLGFQIYRNSDIRFVISGLKYKCIFISASSKLLKVSKILKILIFLLFDIPMYRGAGKGFNVPELRQKSNSIKVI